MRGRHQKWASGIEKDAGGPASQEILGDGQRGHSTRTMAAMALLEGEAEMLTQCAIDAAHDGDIRALKLALDRIIPPRRRPIVQIDLQRLEDFQGAADAHRRVIQATLDGALSLDDAERLSKLINDHMQVADLGEYDWRAQRYLTALFRHYGETVKRLKKLKQTIASGNIAT